MLTSQTSSLIFNYLSYKLQQWPKTERISWEQEYFLQFLMSFLLVKYITVEDASFNGYKQLAEAAIEGVL